jgi:hypothetical protein
MSSKRNSLPLRDTPDEVNDRLVARLRSRAATFPYPATPDIASRERLRLAGQLSGGRNVAAARPRSRRLAFALLTLAIILAAAFLVSPVRARVLDWIRIGAVRIFFTTPSLTPPPLPPTATLPGAPTPHPTATYLQSVLDIGGETSLEEAQRQVDFTILLPADTGQPDLVFLQKYDRAAVILVWLKDGQPGQARMSLTEAKSDSFIFQKYVRRSVEETHVNGQPAVWVEGEYPLDTRSGETTMTRLVTQGHTLIWTQGEMTFRLETDEDLETAIKIAESVGR